jgi:hypothetical protein
MTERHSLVELRNMWTASRDFCQRQLEHSEKLAYADTDSYMDYAYCVKKAQAKIDDLTAQLEMDQVLDDIVGITLA